MTNPKIETDIADILKEIKADQKKILEEVNCLKIGLTKTDGKIDSLDTKVEQLDKRISNQEFAIRGVLIGLIVVILGGFAMFFWMASKF